MKHGVTVFGKGRSGTNGYCLTLSQTLYTKHKYLGEYFPDGPYRLFYLKENPNFIINCTSWHLTDEIVNFLNANSKIILIERKNKLDQFLSHIIAWLATPVGETLTAKTVNFKPNSLWIDNKMFDNYTKHHEKYLDILSKINIDTRVYYEDVDFVDKKYKTNYNLNTKLEYFKNKDQILSYVDKL